MLATALVFSLTLLLGGISASMKNEASRTVDAIAADAWIVPAGVDGPFTSTQTIPMDTVAAVRALPGVREASALVLARETVRLPRLQDLNVIGYELGGIGAPRISSGRAVERDGEIVVDESADIGVGTKFELGGRTYRVVGTTDQLTYMAGTPASFVTLHDAQQLLFAGLPLATTVVTKGSPEQAPRGFDLLDNAAVTKNLKRPVQQAAQTISFLNALLWIIAAGIIGAILYMSALERVRDFAVLKATGCSNSYVFAGLASQAIVLSVAAAVAASLFALVLAPAFPMQVEIAGVMYVVLLGVAIVVGLVASIAGLRRALSVDPALAFGG